MTAKGERVREALEELFSDTSVSQQTTLDDLNEIQSDLETKIDAIEGDIKTHE